ncbi:MAG: TlpA family protein disulfide reductase [Firmicutes bacterium]|nr:TlpA family protein disulfide reductase [Bacillota bacterium]
MLKLNKTYCHHWTGFAMITCLIFLYLPVPSAWAAEKIGPVIGYTAPDFTLNNIALEKVVLSQVMSEHRVTLVNFWGIWCPYCIKEIPDLVRFYGEYHPHGVEILAVNVGDNPRNIPPFVEKNKISFPVLLDLEKRVASLYQVSGYPRTFLIDQHGKIRDIIFGATNYAVLAAKVDALLEGESK